MAVIPQFTAGGPAQARGPVLETQGAVRVDPRGALAAVGNVIEAVQGAAVQNPQLSPMFGQGKARGLQALGQGVQRLGTVFQSIALEEAEARNDAAIFEAQQEMARVYGEFQEWTANAGAMESDRWGEEWQSRLEGWKSSYLQGRKLSPVAQEAIDRSLVRFGTETLIDTRVRSAQDAFRRAKGAATAAWSLAVEAGDLETAQAITADKAGRYFHPDEAAMMDYEAAQKIRERQLSDARLRAETAAMRGDTATARETLDAAPWENPDEKAFALAEFDTKTAVMATTREIENRMASGEDPAAIRAELEARDESGAFKAYPDLPPAVRAKVLEPIYEAQNEEYSAMIDGANNYIESGVIKDEKQLADFFGGMEVDPMNRALLAKKLKGETIKTEDNVISLQLEAAKYDPATDPDGRIFTATRNRVGLIMGDDPRAESILSTLAKRRNGESLTMPERMRAAKTEEMKSIRESEAGFRIPASRIKKATKEGVTVYVDTGADIKPDDPNFFETGKGGFMDFVTFGLGGDGEHIKGRIVTLSQDDRIKVDQGEGEVEDLIEKNRRAAEDAKILDALDQEANAGAIQDEAQWDARYNALALPIKDKAAVSVLENDLFPGTSDDLARRIEEAKRRNAELQRSTEEAPPSPSPMPMLSVPDGIANRAKFVSRLPESIPSRIESTIASVIDPVGAYEDAFSTLSSIAKSIESGKSIDDLKSVIKTALASPESQADFMVDFVALALTRNPRFSNTNLDEAAIASLAAQNAGNETESNYDPGSILLKAIERINQRTETKPDGLPDSPVEIQKVQGSRYGKGREKKSKN